MSNTIRQRLALIACIGLLFPAALIAAAGPDEPQFSSAAHREAWQKGSDQVLVGDFSSAARTLASLKSSAPLSGELDDVLGWIEQCNRLAESRVKLRERIFRHHAERAEKYETLARELDARGGPKPSRFETEEDPPAEEPDKDPERSWKDAMGEVYAALQNTDNEAAFRQLPWVQRIAGETARAGTALRDKREWRDAFILFELLRLTFPDNETYKREARECRQHAHFEAFYTSKGKWKNELKGVDPRVVREILGRASHDYVRELDFKKLTISGLENLILLARTSKLDKVFPTLADRDRVGDFVDRLEQQIGKVRGRKRFDYKDADRVFEDVLRINRETIAVPEAVITDEFVSGLLEPLDDFTSVIWPSDVAEFTKHTRGEFVGVGIQIQKDLTSRFIRVESPLEDTPAYEAGIGPGDLITAVDGKSTRDIDVNQAVELITGAPGSKVTLTVRGPDGVDRPIPLTRRKVKISTVAGVSRHPNSTGWDYMLDPQRKIGYIRINSFMEQTVDDLRLALEQLQRQGCKGLILDLRFNPGGLLRSAVEVSELFLNADEPIVMTKGRNGRPDSDVTAKSVAGFRGLPLIVLVNEGSASASEIVSGALSGRGKAYIVGSRTFGKGLVQNLIPIDDGAAYLKLTTQYYYVPNNDREIPWRCLHREEGADVWGVDPDVQVKVIPYEARKIYKLRRKSDVIKGKGRMDLPAEPARVATTQSADDEDIAAADEFPDTDPQLQTALNIMRIKLLSNKPWITSPKIAIRDPLKDESPAER
jgi:carboxyl-terminal processing protease